MIGLSRISSPAIARPSEGCSKSPEGVASVPQGAANEGATYTQDSALPGEDSEKMHVVQQNAPNVGIPSVPVLKEIEEDDIAEEFSYGVGIFAAPHTPNTPHSLPSASSGEQKQWQEEEHDPPFHDPEPRMQEAPLEVTLGRLDMTVDDWQEMDRLERRDLFWSWNYYLAATA